MKEHNRTHETSTEKLVTDLKRVVHDSQDLLKSSAEAVGERAQMVRERLTDAMEVTKERVAASAKATDKVIRENPYQSIGIAFGVGLLIGVLVARR